MYMDALLRQLGELGSFSTNPTTCPDSLIGPRRRFGASRTTVPKSFLRRAGTGVTTIVRAAPTFRWISYISRNRSALKLVTMSALGAMMVDPDDLGNPATGSLGLGP